MRHQQRPVPFFGTVLADGIDIAAIAAGWGGVGVRRDEGEVFGAGGGAPADGEALVGLAGPGSAASAPPARWLDLVGQGLPAMAMEERAEMATDAGSAVAVEPGSAMVEEAGPNDAAVPGKAGIGEIVQGPYGTGDSAGAGVAGAAVNLDASCLDLGPLFAAQARARRTCPLANSAAAVEAHDPPSPGHDAGATAGVVTRLDQGPGWTVDVVRPRNGG